MGPNYVDEMDCGNFFDQIDDLIKFPPDVESAGYDSSDVVPIPTMWNNPSELPDSGDLFSGSQADDLLAELSVPYEDIVQLEWLSTFVEDSFSSGGGMTIGKENCTKKDHHQPMQQFQTSSPVSVLESSSSSSNSSTSSWTKSSPPLSPSHQCAQRARSKRPRPPTFNPRAGIQLIPALSSFIETPRPFVLDSNKITKPEPQKKKIKFIAPAAKDNTPIPIPIPTGPTQPQAVRKCLHCEITKTPQWRAGPKGPKTLCNACGVRYKSGRLFPEYRPAASPTFVPSLHSNSHKKVVEMRTKGVVDHAGSLLKD